MREQDLRNEELDEAFGSHLDEAAFNDLMAVEEEAGEEAEDDLVSVEDEFIFEGVGCSEEVAEGFNFRDHPAYRKAKHLVETVFDHVEELDDAAEEEASALLCSVTTAAAKLAAAVTTSGSGEPGMTVAYLKRGLRSIEDAVQVLADLAVGGVLDDEDFIRLRAALFDVRDGIVDMTGEARAEWRRLAAAFE